VLQFEASLNPEGLQKIKKEPPSPVRCGALSDDVGCRLLCDPQFSFSMLNCSHSPLTACTITLGSPVRIVLLMLERQKQGQGSCSGFSQSVLVSGNGGRWRGTCFTVKYI